ncbi:SLC13 family permease [Murinocardiopsis flavida]|nr:SLC13 family permease [Murinocardiopsis flavida]
MSPEPPTPADRDSPAVPRRTIARRLLVVTGTLAAAGGLAALYTLLPGGQFGGQSGGQSGLTDTGRGTITVFAAALVGWTLTRLDDVFIGLTAAAALVACGLLAEEAVFGVLGSETIWLLVAACVIAAGVSASGLPARAALALIARARSPRQLAHMTTLAVLLTALAVPATSGRAALVLPVFLALARLLTDRPVLVRALALLFPTVVLLSAVASLIGAAAHLITSEVLAAMTGTGIGFGQWLLLGLPLAVVSSHLAAELVLITMTDRAERRDPLKLRRDRLAELVGDGATGPLTGAQLRMLGVLVGVVVLWCTEPLHGFSPTLVALVGALAATAPGLGTVRMSAALASVPWALLLFMVCTAALGDALARSGAADWLAGIALGGFGPGDGTVVLTMVVTVSAAAHLVLQSRSARSAVLIPVIVPLAVASGLDPAAVAFASTAAAGFCHTLPSSAKPVAMFADLPDVPTYRRADLIRLSALLGPLMVALVLVFSHSVWPHLGLPLR